MITRMQYIKRIPAFKNSSLSYDWYIDGLYLFGIIPLYVKKTKL